MYSDYLTDILYMARNHGYPFVPAAGVDWSGNWDHGKQALVSIHEATTDPAVLTAWGGRYKRCNWLYVPGDEQAVLDDDPRHGGDMLLAELEREYGPLPHTAVAETGGGGLHYHFTVPPGLSFKCDLRGNPGLTLATGGKLGFVVPPCGHRSGKGYRWRFAPWDVRPAPCPAGLLDLCLAAAPAAAKPPAGVTVLKSGLLLPDPGPLTLVWAGGGERLACHPGCDKSKGERRRPKLLELIGRELGLGRTADEIEAEVLDWAGRCEPPLDDREALRHLRGLDRKHEAGQHHTPILFTTESTANEGSKNEVMADEGDDPAGDLTSFLRSAKEDAYTEPEEVPAFLTHGWVGDFTRAVAPQIEGSIEPVVVCVLSCFGSAVGTGPFVRVGEARHRANLFAVCVAPSGIGKSEPWNVCSGLMEWVDADWHRDAVGYGLGSGEGLIRRLEAQPVALSVEAEFGAMLTKARRDGSTLGPNICNAWDGRPLETINKEPLRAVGHHVSVWGNITDAELLKRIGNSLEAVNGFGNRFLWVRQERVRYLPRGGDLRCLLGLAEPLREAVARAKLIRQVDWSAEAGAMWDAAYARLCDVQGEHWSLGRARSQALRLVLVYALLDGAEEISPDHVAAGLSAWRWAEQSARGIFGVVPVPVAATTVPVGLTLVMGGGSEQQHHTTAETVSPADATAGADDRVMQAGKVLARIAAKPGIGRGELMRAVNAKAAVLGDVLTALHADGKAHPRQVSGKGRPAECWFPGPDPGDRSNEGSISPADDGPVADLPSFVWAKTDGDTEGMKEESPADNSPSGGGDFLPSFKTEGQHIGGDGVCGAVVPRPDPYPDADSLEKAIRSVCGSIVKHEDGRCELRLLRPDPGIEAGWQRWGAEIGATYLTERQFFAELEKVRPLPPTG